MKTNFELQETGDPTISIVPMVNMDAGEEALKAILELQLKMATTSMNHEYARMEYDDIDCYQRQEELLEYMQDCRNQYFQARDELSHYDPYALEEFERDLHRQKLQTLVHYNA